MSVVVSDTSPLHYLVLCDVQSVFPALFEKVVIPPMVFRELQQPNTPPLVRQWAGALPLWVEVRIPLSTNFTMGVDMGEMEAIGLAQEIKASAILMDDRAGRAAAIHRGLAVVGTIGLLERAAALELLDLPQVVERLRQTNARVNSNLIDLALARDRVRKQGR